MELVFSCCLPLSPWWCHRRRVRPRRTMPKPPRKQAKQRKIASFSVRHVAVNGEIETSRCWPAFDWAASYIRPAPWGLPFQLAR